MPLVYGVPVTSRFSYTCSCSAAVSHDSHNSPSLNINSKSRSCCSSLVLTQWREAVVKMNHIVVNWQGLAQLGGQRWSSTVSNFFSNSSVSPSPHFLTAHGSLRVNYCHTTAPLLFLGKCPEICQEASETPASFSPGPVTVPTMNCRRCGLS